MARRAKSDEEPNMDSLLDALTNVVGILLLVLILSSIEMTKTVNKILSELTPVSEEQLEKKEDEVEVAKVALMERQKLWSSPSQTPEEIEAAIKQLQADIDRLKKDNSELASLQETLKALKEEIERLKGENGEKTDRNKTSAEKLQGLLVQLSEIPDIEPVPPEKVRLPEPRQSNPDDQARYVLVKNNKVYFIGDVYKHLFFIRDRLDQKWEHLVQTDAALGGFDFTFRSTEKNEAGNYLVLKTRDGRVPRKFKYDFEKVKRFFAAQPDLAGPDLRYEPFSSGGKLGIDFAPKSEGGVSPQELGQQGNRFLNALRQVNRSREYVLFYVNPDSFEAYTLARILADNAQIRASWLFWTGENFRPQNLPYKIEEIEYDWRKHNDLFSKAKLAEIGQKLTPIVAANVSKAEKLNTPVPGPPELVAERERWVKSYSYMPKQLTEALEVAQSMRNRDQLVLERHPPYVPNVAIFGPWNIPTKVKTAEEKMADLAARKKREAEAEAARKKQMQLD